MFPDHNDIKLKISNKNWKQPSYTLQWVKQTVAHPFHGVLLSNENKLLTDTPTWMNLWIIYAK